MRLRVAAVRQPATSLFYVAHAAGCFDRQGLAIEERSYELGRDAFARLGRDADVAVAYETVAVRAALAEPAARLRVIGTLHRSTHNTRLIATPQSGIATFADLRGKRVGVARGTNAELFIELVLRFAGVDAGSVQIVNLAPPSSAQQLADGTIDAAVLSDPVAHQAEASVAGARVLESELYVEFSLLVASAATVEQRGPELRALLRGLLCGERFAREHPAETLAELRRRFPTLQDETLRAQLARVSWRVGLDNLLVDVLREEAEWFAGPARASEVPQLIDAQPLEAAAPERVLLLPSARASKP